MKFVPDMYNLNTFNIPKKIGCQWMGWQRRNEKNSRKCHKIERIVTLTLSKTSLENTKDMDS